MIQVSRKPSLDQVAFQAVEKRREDLGLRCVADKLSILFSLDQAGKFEFPHMVRERCRADVDALAHSGTGGGGSAVADDLFQDFVAARISEGASDELHLVFAEGYELFRGDHILLDAPTSFAMQGHHFANQDGPKIAMSPPPSACIISPLFA